MQTQGNVIRFPFRLCKADKQAVRRLELEDSQVISTRVGPDGLQVRCASGEFYDLAGLRAKRRPPINPDLPPAGAMALSRVA